MSYMFRYSKCAEIVLAETIETANEPELSLLIVDDDEPG